MPDLAVEVVQRFGRLVIMAPHPTLLVNHPGELARLSETSAYAMTLRALALEGLMLSANTVSKTWNNTGDVAFVASPDHFTSLVTSYEARVRTAGTGTLVASVGLGKPTPDGNGIIIVSLASTYSGTTGIQLNVGTGTGYSDVSGKQVVRTSGNLVYLIATNCTSYPCTANTQTVRMYKANQVGQPASFARQDSANEAADAAQCAMAIDGNDLIHVVWLDRNGASNSRIRYRTFNTTTNTWGTAENVDANIGAAEDTGQGDQFCSIALDSSGIPHVAYIFHDGTRRRIAYRNRTGGTWSSQTLVDNNTYTGNRKAWSPCVAFDTSGRRVFAWEVGAFNDDTDGQLCVRVMSTGGSLGTRADLGAATAKVGIDQSTSLYCDGRIHLSYILGGSAGNEDIRYYYATEADSPTFTANHPSSFDTHDPSIGPGPNGGIRIYCHGTESPNNDNLYTIDGAGGAGAWGTPTLYASGAFDCSVSVRWAQYFMASSTVRDVVYWDQNYPNNLYYGTDQSAIGAGNYTVSIATIGPGGTVDSAVSNVFTLPLS